MKKTQRQKKYKFVFGSNRKGRHKRGAAKDALTRWGAIQWQGEGLQGDCYALPTKQEWNINLPLEAVADHILEFLRVARVCAVAEPDWVFLVTRVGTNLAGFSDEDIASVFAVNNPPENCQFDPLWQQYGLTPWEKSPNEIRPENPEAEQLIFDSIYPDEA